MSVLAAAWGANRLVNGQGWVDKVEGIGHLALAAETGLEAASAPENSGLYKGLGLVHAAGELVVGAVDAIRGHQEGSQRRLIAGLSQFTVGAAVATGTLIPTLGPLTSIAVVAATALRQIQLGPPRDSIPQG